MNRLNDLKVKKIDKTLEFYKVRDLFKEVFTKEPWLDDWSDLNQLNLYINDLLDQKNSLAFGLYINDANIGDEVLIGLALGRMVHFYEGNQFRVDEFCIDTKYQKNGFGSAFIHLLKQELATLNIAFILLDTNKTYNAYSFYLKNGFNEIKDSIGLFLKIN